MKVCASLRGMLNNRKMLPAYLVRAGVVLFLALVAALACWWALRDTGGPVRDDIDTADLESPPTEVQRESVRGWNAMTPEDQEKVCLAYRHAGAETLEDYLGKAVEERGGDRQAVAGLIPVIKEACTE